MGIPTLVSFSVYLADVLATGLTSVHTVHWSKQYMITNRLLADFVHQSIWDRGGSVAERLVCRAPDMGSNPNIRQNKTVCRRSAMQKTWKITLIHLPTVGLAYFGEFQRIWFWPKKTGGRLFLKLYFSKNINFIQRVQNDIKYKSLLATSSVILNLKNYFIVQRSKKMY